MKETAPEQKRSKPFVIFQANVIRLISLASTPRFPISETINRLGQQIEDATASAQKFGDTIRAANAGGYDSAAFQRQAASLAVDQELANQILKDLVDFVKTQQFLSTWMIVMLVTFAEAYFEDVLS